MMSIKKPGRNDPCHCGSGRKYKHCCQSQTDVRTASVDVSALLRTALQHHQAGQLPQAETLYRQILETAPNNPDALHLSGLIAHQAGKLDIAVDLISRAIRVKPSGPMYYNLGVSLQAQGQLDAAIESYRSAVALKPDDAEAHSNLGTALQLQGQFEAAIESFRRAIGLKPEAAGAHSNLGVALQAQGQLDAAIESFRRALVLNPDDAEAHNNLGVALLLRADFHAGWREYEWRVNSQTGRSTYIADPRDASRVLPRPSTLLPLALEGKRILLIREQGIGDELFFLRFARAAQQRGAWVAYLPSAKIETLVQRAPGLDAVIRADDIPANLDQIFLVGELPLVLGADRLDTLPPALPLTVLPERRLAIKNRLAALGPGPYLGVTWRAGTERNSNHRKPLLFKEADCSRLGRALSAWPGEVLMLQRHPRAGEIERFTQALGRPAHDLSGLNENLEDMLALLAELDDYVGVSNTNMHLMAGLGKTARVLIPNPPEWRWMTEGPESPWFPGFTLYRQPRDGEWGGVLERLRGDLLNGDHIVPAINFGIGRSTPVS
jgi:Flp pilus assembly protein TadD